VSLALRSSVMLVNKLFYYVIRFNCVQMTETMSLGAAKKMIMSILG